MAMDTIVQQGRFTSNGNRQRLDIRSDVDYMYVYNFTQAGDQQNPGRGVQFYWQRGFANNAGIEVKKTNGADTLEMTTIAVGGFSLLDTTGSPLGALLPTTNIDGDGGQNNSPEVLTGNTGGLVDGDIVRIYNMNDGRQLGGVDFTVSNVVNNTSFDLIYMPQIADANDAGNFRIIRFDPFYYPRSRFISSINQAQQAVVTLTVDHGFTVGQQVRFKVPDVCGMTQIDGLTGNITAVNTAGTNNSITVDIDTTAFDAFNFPVDGDYPFTHAQVVPVGSSNVNNTQDQAPLDDATRNTGIIGMELAAGVDSPAGSNNDVIYWVAGKSGRVNNL